jgi:pilus assembly protein FimV
MGDALNQDVSRHVRFSLSNIALAATLSLLASSSYALGLGRMNVQSALGETLKAEIEFSSLTPEEAASLRVRVASPDAYRAAGLDYNAVLPGTQVQIVRRPDGRSVLRLVSDRAVQEPFVDVVLDISWANGRLSREYTMLFDPPSNLRARAPEAVTAPVISAPPPAASPLAAAPAVQAAPRPAPAPRAPAAPLPTDGTIVVRPGDSLSRIAERNLPAGVSLDQMLVALYRNNGDAFLNNNMNLLRAGAKLKLPSDATATAAAEARQVVRAHSADFDNARRGIATAAPKLPAEPETTAKGVVKAQVQETKPTAPAGDRLTLSKPVPPQVPAPVPAPAPTASKPGDNVAALSKTVDDLKKLSEAAKGGTPVPAATEASAAPAISLPASVAEAASVASAPPVVAPASKPAAVVPPPAPVVAESGGLLGFLTSPLGAALGAVVVLGLGFLGWRTTRKPKPMGSRETMFGESKLQPDSFFGVTGGQRVDTRDGASGVSSMSYSLSQLDAHGDVDPVAEADVYLAYGRDLQAEEILKEALRGTPERMAIRLKLLEVYAKRRDVRGCEQLATQLYADTKGTGDDWEKAQELGRSVDPENRLYQPGGGPRSMFDDEAPRPEPMNASTLPAAVSAFSASAAAAMSPTDEGPPSLLDLDLDLGVDVNTAATQSMPAQPAAAPAPMTMDFTVPDAKPAEAADSGMDFKLDDLDFEASTQNQRLQEMTERQGLTDIGDLGDTTAAGKLTGVDSLIDAVQGLADDDSDPLTRQLELAEEFRQIGDVEGARDVLQELINQVGSGPLYDKAKAMLDLLR